MKCSRCGCTVFHEEVEKLQAENQKLRECLKFYADIETWCSVVPKGQPGSYEVQAVHKSDFEVVNYKSYGGKRARQCLKEIEGE